MSDDLKKLILPLLMLIDIFIGIVSFNDRVREVVENEGINIFTDTNSILVIIGISITVYIVLAYIFLRISAYVIYNQKEFNFIRKYMIEAVTILFFITRICLAINRLESIGYKFIAVIGIIMIWIVGSTFLSESFKKTIIKEQKVSMRRRIAINIGLICGLFIIFNISSVSLGVTSAERITHIQNDLRE